MIVIQNSFFMCNLNLHIKSIGLSLKILMCSTEYADSNTPIHIDHIKNSESVQCVEQNQ